MTEPQQRFGHESIVTAFLFVIAIFFFGLATSVDCSTNNDNNVATPENRSLASFQKPDLHNLETFADFPKSFDAFFSDRFFHRLDFTSVRSYFRYRWFSIGSNVLVGKNGWLFYAAGRGMEFIQNDPLFTDSELFLWCKLLEYKNAWCKAHEIKFLFYAAPLASTIYPELLPNGIRRNTNNSRLDQLFDHLTKTTLVRTVDVRPILLSSKSLPIYLKTDTHWNSYGSFLATTPVINALRAWFPNIPEVSSAELHLEPKRFEGNLPSFMGVSSKISEFTLREKANVKRRWHAVDPEYDKLGGNYKRSFATEIDDKNLPTAVCIRDSFCISQREYLSNHFRRIVYEWETEWPLDLIEKEKPDVVVQEKSEGTIIPLQCH